MKTPRIEENIIEKDGQFYIRCEAHEEVVRRAHQAGREEERERIVEIFDRYSETHHWHKDKCMGHVHNVDCPSVLFRREALNNTK